MDFSPLVLLRQPVYSLSHLDAFALDLDRKKLSDDDIEKLREKFLTFIQSKHLLRSLPFSSKTVYNAIPHYEFHAAVKIRKKEKQSERGFMKYLQRMTLNCSPLADFAGTQFCNWDGSLISAKSKFRLELALSQRKEFFDLCYCDVGLQGLMRHRLNPSLTKEGDGYVYLFNDEGEENLVRIESSPEFDDVYNRLKKADFTFAEFVEQSDFDVNELLDAKLITPAYPSYGEIDLIEQIVVSINDRHKIGFDLEEILGRDFDKLDDSKVLTLQKDWIKKIQAYSDKLEVVLNDKLYPERIFYLNSAYDNCTKPEFDHEQISMELKQLVVLIKSLEKETSSEKVTDLYATPEDVEIEYTIENVEISPAQQEGVVHIELDKNQKVPETLNNEPIGVMLSHTKAEKPKLVNVTTAHGKFFAPSLPLAKEDVHSKIKEWLELTSSDKVALKDDSTHSKNKSHCYLKELDNFGLDFHSPIKDRVKPFVGTNGVADENGNLISTVNLGIESLDTRSNMLRNIQQASFNLPDVGHFTSKLQEHYAQQLENGITLLPGIELKYSTLAYTSWVINSLIQLPERQEELLDNIVSMNAWRKELNIPRLVSYTIDSKQPAFLDFHNPWSVDIFLRGIKNFENSLVISDLGVNEKITGIQVKESYFEFVG